MVMIEFKTCLLVCPLTKCHWSTYWSHPKKAFFLLQKTFCFLSVMLPSFLFINIIIAFEIFESSNHVGFRVRLARIESQFCFSVARAPVAH